MVHTLRIFNSLDRLSIYQSKFLCTLVACWHSVVNRFILSCVHLNLSLSILVRLEIHERPKAHSLGSYVGFDKLRIGLHFFLFTLRFHTVAEGFPFFSFVIDDDNDNCKNSHDKHND